MLLHGKSATDEMRDVEFSQYLDSLVQRLLNICGAGCFSQ